MSSMKCACGMEFGPSGKYAFGYHRQECPAFWQSIKAEMENISRKLRGKPTPVSSREWEMHRSRELPNAKSLIDWLGAWSAVQSKVGLGVSTSGPKATAAPAVTPPLDDFIEMVLDLSDQYYGNGLVIGCNLYDDIRPAGWPMHRTMLKMHGYALNADGWNAFIFHETGLYVATKSEVTQHAYEQKEVRQARAVQGFDYRQPPTTERMQALLSRSGLLVCEDTYQRTGRMVLR